MSVETARPAAPPEPVWLEDLEIGEVRRFGRYEVTRGEILEFGRRFDPQPFHVDAAAAERSPYGGLIASGWHTTAIMMRMLVDEFIGRGVQSLGSPGVDELRWLLPVRPGDVLTMRVETLSKRPSGRRPGMGSVRLAISVRNQRDEEVMTMVSIGLIRRRPGPAVAEDEA